MKILLINNNPVVSRLTALSARKEDIEIDEIEEVTELSSDTYDIVFVDADSWTKDVHDVISENINTKKMVLFYGDGDEERKASFDLSILKPFLPSEVSAVIRSIEEESGEGLILENKEMNFNILDDTKEEDRDELFTLDEIEEKKELEEISLDNKLEELFPLKINTLDDDLFNDESKVDLTVEDELVPKSFDKKLKEDTELFDLDLSDEIPSLDDDLFREDKKEETLGLMDDLELEDEVVELTKGFDEASSLLLEDNDLVTEVDEPVLEEVKKETQILDELEIENIKGILTEDSSNDMSLTDLMPVMNVEKEEDSNSLDIDSNVLAQTLAAMPVENLRQLLAGAKVNIKIKFPKSK